MAKSIAQAQAENKRFVDGENENISEYSDKAMLSAMELIFADYADLFLTEIKAQLNKPRGPLAKPINASGKLEEKMEPLVYDNGTGFEIRMLDYYDFVNKGVKGVKSSRNAPNSPYKYKNYGMSVEGRQSIKRYIESGKAKVSIKQKAVGYEQKNKSLIDAQVEQMVYNIKKYGIKQTGYFDAAVEKVFKNFSKNISQAIGRQIAIEIIR